MSKEFLDKTYDVEALSEVLYGVGGVGCKKCIDSFNDVSSASLE